MHTREMNTLREFARDWLNPKDYWNVFVCSVRGHVVELTEEDAVWCKANTDGYIEVECVRFEMPGEVYWSVEEERVKAYGDDGPEVFGDVYRD